MPAPSPLDRSSERAAGYFCLCSAREHVKVVGASVFRSKSWQERSRDLFPDEWALVSQRPGPGPWPLRGRGGPCTPQRRLEEGQRSLLREAFPGPQPRVTSPPLQCSVTCPDLSPPHPRPAVLLFICALADASLPRDICPSLGQAVPVVALNTLCVSLSQRDL